MAVISTSILPLPETANVQVYTVDIKSLQNMTIWYIPVNMDHTIYTIVTKNPDVIRRWIEGVYAHFGNGLRRRFVGMEVELDVTTGRARTVQFCVENRCMVIQLEENQPNCPPSLLQFIRDHNRFAFVCSQAALKIRPLEMALRLQGGGGPSLGTVMTLDLWHYQLPILTKWSILIWTHRAVRRDQGVVDFHWGGPNAYQLSPAEVNYACIDVFLNIHIAKSIWNLN